MEVEVEVEGGVCELREGGVCELREGGVCELREGWEGACVCGGEGGGGSV